MEEFWQAYTQFIGEYGIVVFLPVVLGSILVWWVYKEPERKVARLRRWRGKLMKDARRAYLRSRLADHITDGLEDDWWDDRITLVEKLKLYAECGSKLGIKDLLPKNGRRSQELLKREVKHRLNSNRYYGTKIIFPDCPGWAVRFNSNTISRS